MGCCKQIYSSDLVATMLNYVSSTLACLQSQKKPFSINWSQQSWGLEHPNCMHIIDAQQETEENATMTLNLQLMEAKHGMHKTDKKQ